MTFQACQRTSGALSAARWLGMLGMLGMPLPAASQTQTAPDPCAHGASGAPRDADACGRALDRRLQQAFEIYDRAIGNAGVGINVGVGVGGIGVGVGVGVGVDGNNPGNAGSAGGRADGGVATAGPPGPPGKRSRGPQGKQQRGKGNSNNNAGGGPMPNDLGDGENDDLIARQLREAALAEKDKAVQAKLWEEYRKYKAAL